MKVFELIPDGSVKIPLRWLGVGVLAVVSISIGYGEYKSQTTQIVQDRQDLHDAVTAITDLRIEMSDLKRAVADLKDSIERSR